LNQTDGGIDGVGGGKAERTTPAAGQARHGGTAGQSQRDPKQDRANRRDQEAADDPSSRFQADHAQAGDSNHRQEQDRADTEHQQQCVAGISAGASQPIGRGTARRRAQRRIGRVVAAERDRAGEADRHEERAPGADGETAHGFAQRVAPVWR